MAKAAVIQKPADTTPLRIRIRRAFRRTRRALLPLPWAIRWEMRDNRIYYAKELERALSRQASRLDIAGVEAMAAHEYWMLEEELDMFESARLLRTASRLRVPEPPIVRSEDDPNWRQGTSYKPTWYLKPEAMKKLRDDIRAERRARREPIVEWTKLVGSAGGAVYLLEKVVHLIRR